MTRALIPKKKSLNFQLNFNFHHPPLTQKYDRAQKFMNCF